MQKMQYLKTWPRHFENVLAGRKFYEIRKNDRHLQEGDIVVLQEWNPETQQYTGREIEGYQIGTLIEGEFGLKKGYCVFSLLPNARNPTLRADGTVGESLPLKEHFTGYEIVRQCDVVDLQGNHCPELPTHTENFYGNRVHLCHRCFTNVLNGEYGYDFKRK